MEDDKLDLIIRLGEITDLSFICKTWANNEKQIYPNNFALDFFQKYNEYIKSLIDKSVILVSCLSDSPNDIIGFIVYTSFDSKCVSSGPLQGSRSAETQPRCVVHFAYTRPDERKDGICNTLLKTANVIDSPIIFTSPAKNPDIMKHLCSKYIFDPSLVNII